ncbi:hypothetical protein D3871_25505 [Noviherbaspirillum saxi]|uniref:Uncharacterized protein n=2 Tax=Noviherbaspirillum saxi TaxID=2320863 RepID=A0A3A3FY59_9BURK|nr:hypothetical protein D3871_25505 [Noviherbaspirillum saxi]
MEERLQQWQNIPPALTETAGTTAGLWPGWDELRESIPGILMSQLVPSWLEPATSDIAVVVSDITSTLRQTEWVPRLDQRISQAPCFREIRNQYADVSLALQRALAEFISARAEVLMAVRKGKVEKSTIDLYRASHETLTHYIDTAGAARVAHQKAAGIVRHRLEDNRASTTVKIIRAGAAATAANVLSPLFEAAQMVARNSDRARANRVIDELNMRFADILNDGCEAKAASQLKETDIDARKLRKQWKGPMESRLELVAEALDYEAKQECNERAHRLLVLQRDLVMKGDLGGLGHQSRAAELLVNDSDLLRAALKARLLGDGAVARLSKAYCTRALSDTLGIVSEEASSALLDGLCSDQVIDAAASAATAAETSLVMGSGVMARQIEPSASHLERRHVSTLSYLGQLTKVGTRLYKNTVATARSIPQMWHNARDGIHGAQQGSAIDRDLAQARVMMAEGIIGACVGDVMTAAKSDSEVKVQNSFDVLMPLLYGLKGKGHDWHRNRLKDAKLKITTYIPIADVGRVKEVEQNNETVLLLLKTEKANLVFFKGLKHRGSDAWYQIDDDGLNLRHVPTMPLSELMKGLEGTVVEVLVASRTLHGEATDRPKQHLGKDCRPLSASLRLRPVLHQR